MLSARELTGLHLEERIEMDNRHAKQFEQLVTQHSKEIARHGQSAELSEKHEKEMEETDKFFRLERQRLYEAHEKEFQEWRELKKLTRTNDANLKDADSLEKEKRRQEIREELERLRPSQQTTRERE